MPDPSHYANSLVHAAVLEFGPTEILPPGAATSPRHTRLSPPRCLLRSLLLKARRFNASLVGSDDVPFAALAEREGVSPSYFTRLVRLSYLAPDITHAILDGRQPRDLTAEKLLDHSRLPLACTISRTALGFA